MIENKNTGLYHRVCKCNYTAQTLKNDLENKVLLAIYYDTIEHKCRCRSYTYFQNGLQIYSPSHTLLISEDTEQLAFESSQQWHNIFLQENSYIDIRSEYYEVYEYSTDIEQLDILLHEENELYLSNDKGNFYGPLECDFIEWWLENHPEYHTDTISKIIDGFEVSEAGTLLDYDGIECDTVTIPRKVRRIGTLALAYSEFRRIIIPDGVLSIEERAFDQCSLLEEVEIPDSVTSIGSSAFSSCSSLKRIKIPSKVKEIEDSTFSWCENLEEVILPKNLEKISMNAFCGCEKLHDVTLPKSLKQIKAFAFSGTNVKTFAFVPEDCKVADDVFGSK